MQRAKAIPEKQQMDLILKCRKSGLTDREWCEMNEIKLGTFYNWVSRIRRNGHYDIPERDCSINPEPEYQDVVRVDILPDFTKGPMHSPNSGFSLPGAESFNPTIEIVVGSKIIRLSNNASPELASVLLRSMGGAL